MTNTKHLKNKNKNKVTQKIKKTQCSISLKPFEKKFSETISPKQLKLSNKKKKKEMVKELLTKFAPNSIKPNNDFYDYINYQWLKNVSLKKQQKYIVQIDDFRLAQDKVFHELDELILQYIKTHNNKLSKNLKNFYTSVTNMNPKPHTRQLAKEAVQLVNDFVNKHISEECEKNARVCPLCFEKIHYLSTHSEQRAQMQQASLNFSQASRGATFRTMQLISACLMH
jgi:hypothetical protein